MHNSYNILAHQPRQIIWSAERGTKFFRNVDCEDVSKVFWEKGWKMRLEELNSGEITLHLEALEGSRTNAIGINPGLLYTMWNNKRKAVAWLALFAEEAEKIN